MTKKLPMAATRALAGGTLLLGLAAPWQAQAQNVDLKQAAGLFATHCSECHSVKEGKDKKGPSLFGIVNRKAAQAPGFAYSDAMKQSGLAWSTANLDAYIQAPAQRVPGGKMKYDGLANAEERALIIQYLASIAGSH